MTGDNCGRPSVLIVARTPSRDWPNSVCRSSTLMSTATRRIDLAVPDPVLIMTSNRASEVDVAWFKGQGPPGPIGSD
jgi:hypothetical protein